MLPVFWEWDATLNSEIRVIKVRSIVDPVSLGWGASDWRASVRWVGDQWEKSNVVAYTFSFEPDTPYIYPAETGVIQISVQDPAEVTPGQTWWGYSNPHNSWPENLVQSADVWVSKFAPQDYLQYIVAHEFGHILGLDHRSYPAKTCMRSPAIKFGPDDEDLTAIREVYLA
jgi:hypothetical protein